MISRHFFGGGDLMSDQIGFNIVNARVTSQYPSSQRLDPSSTGAVDGTQHRTTQKDLQDIGTLSPELASQQARFFNMALNHVDSLRYPAALQRISESSNPAIRSLSAASSAATPLNGDTTKSDSIVNKMIAGDTPVKPTETEASVLKKTLEVVPPEILKFNESRGVKFQVVHQGDDITQLKVLRSQEPNEKKLPEMQKFRTELDKRLTPIDKRLQDLEIKKENILQELKKNGLPEKKQDEFPFGGLFGQDEPKDPKLDAITDEMDSLKMEKGKILSDKINESGLAVKPFTFPMASGNMMITLMAVNIGSQPQPLEAMADIHGAKTPEEKKEFYKTMEALNGDNLKKAQAEILQNYEESMKSITDPQEKKKADEYFQELKKYPESIPMDHIKHNILVPDTYYYHAPGTPGNQQGTRYDIHDFETIMSFHDESGKVSTGKTKDGDPDGIMGQYFHLGDVNRILVRSFRLEKDTPVHELGHSLDHLMKKENPGFHEDWAKRVKTAYDNVDKPEGTQSISDYSRTNTTEYVAEGFKLFYIDPERLNTKDPALYSLIEEITKKAIEADKKK